MTAPLTPANCDLRDFPHTPLFRSRLFGSTFHARATDAEWRAGVTLWLKSWDQVPAGSLPLDDIDLCRLAELARDMKAWRKVKAGALRGWIECEDGRLYHPVVAEGVNNALEHKVKQRLKTAKARITALEKHLKEAKTEDDRARITGEIERIRLTLSHGLSQTVSQLPREGEGEEREKGFNSEAKASAVAGASAAVDKSTKTEGPPVDKRALWDTARDLLVAAKIPESSAREFVGSLVGDYGLSIAAEAVESAVKAKPLDPKAYLTATCKALKAKPAGGQYETAEQTRARLDADSKRSIATPEEIAAIKARGAGVAA